MIRRAVIVLGVPLLVLGAAAGVLAAWLGPYQLMCAAIAAALTVPPGLVTLVLSERMARGSPFGAFAALAVGTFIRLGVGFGGAVAVFLLARPSFAPDPIAFWVWLLGAYLTTLVVEMALLGRNPAGRTTAPRDPV